MLLERISEIFLQIMSFLDWLMLTLGLTGYFIVLVLQAIIAPIPSEATLMLGGWSYGFFLGGLVGWLGTTTGSVITFYISRKGGRPIAIKLVGERTIAFADRWFRKWGGWAVLLGRLIPFIPFDGISYGAGLTKMEFRTFIIASTLGGIPRSFLYAWLGYTFRRQLEGIPLDLLLSNPESRISVIILVVISLLIIVGYYLINKKYSSLTNYDGSANDTTLKD